MNFLASEKKLNATNMDNVAAQLRNLAAKLALSSEEKEIAEPCLEGLNRALDICNLKRTSLSKIRSSKGSTWTNFRSACSQMVIFLDERDVGLNDVLFVSATAQMWLAHSAHNLEVVKFPKNLSLLAFTNGADRILDSLTTYYSPYMLDSKSGLFLESIRKSGVFNFPARYLDSFGTKETPTS